jgi:hypothetical protein
MKKTAPVNKFAVIGASILGLIGVLVGTMSDHSAPCRDVAESFLKSSAEVKSRIGKINSLTLTRRVSVEASTTEGAYVSYTFIVRGDTARASIVVKADSQSCSFTVESIDAD